MDFTTFVRKPFTVEAVEVTKENIAEIAQFVGVLRHKENGDAYIEVDQTRVPNVLRVYPGFYMTRMGRDNIRCYAKKVFKDQFAEVTAEYEAWLNSLDGGSDVKAESAQSVEATA